MSDNNLRMGLFGIPSDAQRRISRILQPRIISHQYEYQNRYIYY
jgi:hypothetical protein